MRAVEVKLRQVGAGRALYQVWHRPRAAVKRSIREGGPLQQWRTRRGQRAMERAAAALSPITLAVDKGLVPTHFLSGSRFWYQTAFCIWSYAKHAKALPRVVVHDDGSLTRDQATALQALIPGVKFVWIEEAETRLRKTLPADRFPELNRQWRRYINIRKLVGVHLDQGGWRLVLDSDMLFHASPGEMLRWQLTPDSILVMQDAVTSYGYDLRDLGRLCGKPVPELINVGVAGLNSEMIDWRELESQCRSLVGTHGDSYYLEQALVAMLAARHGFALLPPATYRLVPDREPLLEDCILRHYVDLAKGVYFQKEWSRAMAGANHASEFEPGQGHAG